MNTTDIKYFTPKEAERTLPLVKQIVKDILDASFQIRTIVESLGGSMQENDEVKKLARDINGYIKELEEIGCFYKDWNFSIGLIDFPSVINGEDVFLCWRSDEDSIRYYHGINDGYAGRREIPEYLLNQDNSKN